MEIPYTVSTRPDTGLWNAKVGIWLFLASEVMLFGGLFAGYLVLRVGSTSWMPGRDFGDQIEIVSGLNGNDPVISNPPDSIVTGQRVQVVQPTATAGGGQ